MTRDEIFTALLDYARDMAPGRDGELLSLGDRTALTADLADMLAADSLPDPAVSAGKKVEAYNLGYSKGVADTEHGWPVRPAMPDDALPDADERARRINDALAQGAPDDPAANAVRRRRIFGDSRTDSSWPR